MDSKLSNEIKSMHINSLACVRVKERESKSLRINSGLKQGCIISSWLFSVHMNAVKKEVKMGK